MTERYFFFQSKKSFFQMGGLFADYSNYTTISDVRTFNVARIRTSDPSIKISLSFEVITHG